jgi:mannose-1-phosphate guanylyltransferase
MSRAAQPKQLIPFIDGKSLLQIALARLDGLAPVERQYICAGVAHRQAIVQALGGFDARCYLGEPMGRDTLNAVGLGAAVIAQRDPNAVIAVFTADHIIEPVDEFQRIVERGYALAEAGERTLVTFGITPTHAATGYGYLQLGTPISSAGKSSGDAYRVDQFKEKPDEETAQRYHQAGPTKYLWNSGMFVWQAAALLAAIRKFTPQNHEGLMRIAKAWDSDRRDTVLGEVYPTLKKISVDFAVMEPASNDTEFTVAALPMPLKWLDVGSWPSYAETRPRDEHGNAIAAGRHAVIDCKDMLIASSDDQHVVTAIGCENLIVIHTPQSTLVCHADHAQDIKKLHALLGEKYGDAVL